MKKILVLTAVVALVGSLGFAEESKPAQPLQPAPAPKVEMTPRPAPMVHHAQPGAKPAGKVSPKETVIRNLSGRVESVSLADPVKGTKSEVVVVDKSGKKISLLVKVTTTIYDAEAKTITLDQIKKDDQVRVKYTITKEGVKEAMIIRLFKPLEK